MKFDEAMATDEKEDWEVAVDDEHDNVKHVLKVKSRDKINHNAKILPTTWATKKKASAR